MNPNDTSDREIVITRILNAPRELVFEMFTNPEHLKHWWGPNGFTITNHGMDAKVGGAWRFMMHGPDGTDYPNRIRYIEIVKPEKLVYAHDSDDDSGKNDPHAFTTTITFEKEGEKTKLTMKAVLQSAEALQYVVKEHGAIEGGKHTLARLEAYLAENL